MAANRRGISPNAVGGGVQAGLRPEEVDGARNVLSSAVAGRSYHPLFSSGRSDAAGYTTSSPGWRHDAPIADLFPAAPAGPPTDMSVAGPWGAGFGGGGGAAPRPGGDRGPQTTGAIPGPERAATPQMIANATTTPSALFEPLSNAGVNTPSALFQPLPTQSPTSVPGLPNFDVRTPTNVPGFLPVPTSPSSVTPPLTVEGPSRAPPLTVEGPSRAQATPVPQTPTSITPPTPSRGPTTERPGQFSLKPERNKKGSGKGSRLRTGGSGNRAPAGKGGR